MQTDFNKIAELRELVKPPEMGVRFARIIEHVRAVGDEMWRAASAIEGANACWTDFRREAERAEVAP